MGNTYRCFPGRAVARRRGPDQLAAQRARARGRQTLPGVVGIEYSGVDLDAPTPRPIEVLFHSPVVCGTTHQHDFADAVYYTTPSGAGVFDSGTQDWVCGMDPYCTGPAQSRPRRPPPGRHQHTAVHHVPAGPADRAHPAIDNLTRLRIKAGVNTKPPPISK